MKKLYLTIGVILMLGLVSAGIFSSIANRSKATIEIDSVQKNILETRNLTNPTISEMICDGTTCRSCSKKGNYGMGCVSIPQEYCSKYNETCYIDEEEICQKECIEWSEYSDSELENLEAKAYKIRWEGIADVIVEREGKTTETKFNKSDVQISSKAIEIIK